MEFIKKKYVDKTQKMILDSTTIQHTELWYLWRFLFGNHDIDNMRSYELISEQR